MEYLADTANLEEIKRLEEFYPLSGVTTNPSIVIKEGKIDFFQQMNMIRTIIGYDKMMHIQVTAPDVEGMLRDADAILAKVDSNVFVKVPVTENGMKVIKKLKKQGTGVTATCIYSKQQGYLAMECGADYIAPYVNRMENLGVDAEDVIHSFANAIANYHYSTKILAASFKNLEQINKAFAAGAHSATADSAVLRQAFTFPSIQKAVDDFEADWNKIYEKNYLADLA